MKQEVAIFLSLQQTEDMYNTESPGAFLASFLRSPSTHGCLLSRPLLLVVDQLLHQTLGDGPKGAMELRLTRLV